MTIALKRWVRKAADRILQNDRLAQFLRWRLSRAPLDAMFPRGHYYSPLPDVRQMGAVAQRVYRPDPSLCPATGIDSEEQVRRLESLLPFLPEFLEEFHPEGRNVATAEHAGYLFDGFTLHAMVRQLAPNRIVEIGSGYSSGIMARARRATQFPNFLCFVDPNPETLRKFVSPEDLRDPGIAIFEQEVQTVPTWLFESLEPGDVLFIDSSHVVKFGSDVHHLIFDVIPRLRPGVIVHFHDIFWPFEYPLHWVKRGCAWNEAYFVRTMLQFTGMFEVLLFNHYIEERRPDALLALPEFLRESSGSIWLKKGQV